MLTPSSTTSPLPAAATAAVQKFLAINDDLGAIRRSTRRVFFEFLRTCPTLPAEDVENLWAVADLLSDLDQACR